MTEIRGIKVRWEDLSTDSPMNRLFNDFFRLNKRVLGIPNECRDANFSRYAYEQALSFYQMHHIRYGKALAESFIKLTKTFPKMVRTFWERKQRISTVSGILGFASQVCHCEPIGNYVTAILMDFMEELQQRSKEERNQIWLVRNITSVVY